MGEIDNGMVPPIDAADIVRKFKEFLEKDYESELLDAIRCGRRYLLFDFQKLARFDPMLGDVVLDQPVNALKAGELAVRDLRSIGQFKLVPQNLPGSSKMNLERISSKDVGRLVWVEGTVVESKGPLIVVNENEYRCPSCGKIISLQQKFSALKEPTRCECGRKGKFEVVHRTLGDEVQFSIQDTTTKNLSVKYPLADIDLAEGINRGVRVGIIGIPARDEQTTKTGGTARATPLCIEALHVAIISTQQVKSTQDCDEMLDKLDPFQFEVFVGELFKKLGCAVLVTSKTGDGGVDVVMTKEGAKAVVQCKKNAKGNPVGREVVDKLVGAMRTTHEAKKGILVTTSSFTPGAIRHVAEHKLDIELWDHDVLLGNMLKAFRSSEEAYEEGVNILNHEEKEDEEPARVDIDAYASCGITSELRAKILIVKEIIRELENKLGKAIPIEEILKAAHVKNVSSEELEECFRRLRKAGDIFEPKHGFISRI